MTKQILPDLDMPAIMKSIIKRLWSGWKANYNRGILVDEWWHPPTDQIETMTPEEFFVMRLIDIELDSERMR
jgi:hypothetical protein